MSILIHWLHCAMHAAYLSDVLMAFMHVPCIACNVFVNRVWLHALFSYIIRAMSVLKDYVVCSDGTDFK